MSADREQNAALNRGATARARERAVVLGLAAALVVFRSAVLVFFESSRFDSDQALIGLMARHLVEGRALPVFTYRQPYMLGVEAWMAAPFFMLGGTTVAMLKLPLLLVNVATAVLLVILIERECGLRPIVALVPALPFILAAPGTATLLLEASGGNVEPFLYVLLLWMARRRPMVFGAVLAFGVLQREFTVYALGSLALLSLADRSLLRRTTWQPLATGLVSFCAMWQGVYVLKRFSSIDGPGTSPDWTVVAGGANLAALVAHVCVDAGRMLAGFWTLATTHLGDLAGATPRPLADYFISSTVSQGAVWLWPLLGGALVLATARLGWLIVSRRIRPWAPPVRLATFLWLVGVQAVAVNVLLRCGAVEIGYMRYSLLGVFGATGLIAAVLVLEPSRRLRMAAVLVTILWVGVSARDHARLAAEYVRTRPVDGRRLLADHLVDRGIRFAYADFWDAYTTMFYADERVIIACTSQYFIAEYQWLVREHAAEAYWIRRTPCEGGTAIAGWLYVCPPG